LKPQDQGASPKKTSALLEAAKSRPVDRKGGLYGNVLRIGRPCSSASRTSMTVASVERALAEVK